MGRPPKSNEIGFQDVAYSAKVEFGSWNYALKIAGIQTYREWRNKNCFSGKLRKVLNCNPLTLSEIRNELDVGSECTPRIITVIKQDKKIKSIGPRKSMVYYLEGQEALAQTRLDKIIYEIPAIEEEIFYRLRNPMTRSALEKSLFENKMESLDVRKISKYLGELVSARLIYKVRFRDNKKRGHSSMLTCEEIFGKLAYKTYYCRFDCPNEVAELILKNISNLEQGQSTLEAFAAKNEIDEERKRNLKRILPFNVFQIIKPTFSERNNLINT